MRMRIIKNILTLMAAWAIIVIAMIAAPVVVVSITHDEQAGIGAIWAVGIVGCIWVIRLAVRFVRP